MPSKSLAEWGGKRSDELDEIERAHAAVGGSSRGRRFATQQINRAYAVLLASQFQGFCRDLHSECVDHMMTALASTTAMHIIIKSELTRGRKLDSGNAQPGSLGEDFKRLGIDLWDEVYKLDPLNRARNQMLENLNKWRNAIVHQTLDPSRLGGTTVLRLNEVRRWRVTCERLATSFDEALRAHLLGLTGTSPW
jgi:RiboL-PSP-HEPN